MIIIKIKQAYRLANLVYKFFEEFRKIRASSITLLTSNTVAPVSLISGLINSRQLRGCKQEWSNR